MKDTQKMNITPSVLLGISIGAAALIAAACSSEDSNTPMPMPSVNPTGVTPGPTTTGPGPTPTGPVTNPTVSPTTTSTGPTPTGPTTPEPELSQCTSTDYEAGNVGNENTNFSATRNIYVYGDGTTSACTDDTTTVGTLCVQGNATDATADFINWGAGVGLQLAETSATGTVIAPWNAAALGITSLRFTGSNIAGRPLRVQISQIDDPAIATEADNYQANGFLWGGSSPKTAKDGETVIALADFKLPSWAKEKIEKGLGAALPAGGDVLDATKLHSLQFQVASNPKDATEKYSFCLSKVEWLDAQGVVVPVEVTSNPGGDAGVDTSAPANSSGETSSAPASSGEETNTPVNFQSDVLPIFTANCGQAGMCHNANPPSGGLNLFTAEPNAARAAEIVERVKATDPGERMPRGAAALSADNIAIIEAWASSRQ